MATALNNSAAVGVIGKNVLALGDQVIVDGTGKESVTVGVDGTGGDATLTILDANGKEVGSREVGAIGGGRQEIELGDAVAGLEPGQYTCQLTVTDAAGQPVKVQTYEHALIDGVRYGSQGAMLLSGSLEIPLANVVEIISQTD
jgi:flagellar hook assembly protein FlgD